MSTSEQQVVSQIAEMRESLRAADAARRTGGIISKAAVVVGLLIVLSFLYALYSLVQGFQGEEKKAELQAVFQQEIKLLQLDNKAKRLMDQVSPILVEELKGITKDIDAQKIMDDIIQPTLKELEPVLRQQLERVKPRLLELLQKQGDEALTELKERMQEKLGDRLAGIIDAQEGRIGGEISLTEEDLAKLIANLQDASLGALKQAVIRSKNGQPCEIRAGAPVVVTAGGKPVEDFILEDPLDSCDNPVGDGGDDPGVDQIPE